MPSPRRQVPRPLPPTADDPDQARRELFEKLYEELRRLARSALAGKGMEGDLNPTALVHEAFVRFVEAGTVDLKSRTHFFGIAAHIMRQLLVDHARERGALKRGGKWSRIILRDELLARAGKGVQLEALEEALARLEQLAPRQCSVVEMRFFAGMTEDEIARELGVTARTVRSDWKFARAWLRRALSLDERER